MNAAMSQKRGAKKILVVLWGVGGVVLLGSAVAEGINLLNRIDPFRFSQGPEQSILIIGAFGIIGILQAATRAGRVALAKSVQQIVSVPVLVGTAIWLLFGGPAHAPWFFSLATAAMLAASICTLAR